MIHHYLLTRFNLPLWAKDKTGKAIERGEWLKRRIYLFETYCLPSVIGQTCHDFSWILLTDEDTPTVYREKIKSYRISCPQIRIVGVRAEYAFRFADIFRQVVQADLLKEAWNEGDLCLTTYLDNDDCIARTFVEKVQAECLSFHLQSDEKRFLSFDYGLQLFTDMEHLTTRVFYPNNHFLTLAERLSLNDTPSETSHCSLPSIRTCYGYGSHFLLEKQGIADVYHVRDKRQPMWIEVIHEENVDNDVKMTFNTHLINDKDLLHRDFSLPMNIGRLYRVAFTRRAIAQMWRRLTNKIANR